MQTKYCCLWMECCGVHAGCEQYDMCSIADTEPYEARDAALVDAPDIRQLPPVLQSTTSSSPAGSTISTAASLSSPASLQVYVRASLGKVITLDVATSATIADLKVAIQYKEDIPLNLQTLIFAGKLLEDACPLWRYRTAAWLSLELATAG